VVAPVRIVLVQRRLERVRVVDGVVTSSTFAAFADVLRPLLEVVEDLVGARAVAAG
jgi:hypothetical protein